MSQDLLNEFNSLHPTPPAPAHSFVPTPTSPDPSDPSAHSSFSSFSSNIPNRRFTYVDHRDPFNLNLPPPSSRPQLPLHNVPLVRTASHGHQQRASATNFDDLLGIVGSPQAPWPPRAPHVARPLNFHGMLPSSSKIDPFAALGTDFSGSDGRGGRFTPPPPRSVSRNDLDRVDGRRKSSAGKPMGVGTFGGFLAPTPPPDLLGMEEDEDDFGDFASATPAPAPAPAPVNTYSGGFKLDSTPSIIPIGNGILGVQQSGGSVRNNASLTLKPNHRHQKSLIDDDDDFGEFMTSPTTSAPPQRVFNTPPPSTLNAYPLSTFSSPTGNAFNAPLPNTFSPPPQNTNHHSISLKSFSSPPKAKPTSIPPQPQIPPVSVLLTAFPPLFLLPQTHLLDKLTALPFPLRQRVLAHPKTKEFLESVCELGRVAGRVIAGRKKRNRPTLPSARNQSGSRGSGGGMKLGATGGTNANWEQQKEEREVKETCRLWGDGTGRLKAAMGKGVPEIVDEAIGGRGAVGRGSISGAEECRLCGLGRGDVVGRLKENVERASWWAKGWGHGGCKAFWERHGKGLNR